MEYREEIIKVIEDLLNAYSDYVVMYEDQFGIAESTSRSYLIEDDPAYVAALYLVKELKEEI